MGVLVTSAAGLVGQTLVSTANVVAFGWLGIAAMVAFGTYVALSRTTA